MCVREREIGLVFTRFRATKRHKYIERSTERECNRESHRVMHTHIDTHALIHKHTQRERKGLDIRKI